MLQRNADYEMVGQWLDGEKKTTTATTIALDGLNDCILSEPCVGVRFSAGVLRVIWVQLSTFISKMFQRPCNEDHRLLQIEPVFYTPNAMEELTIFVRDETIRKETGTFQIESR